MAGVGSGFTITVAEESVTEKRKSGDNMDSTETATSSPTNSKTLTMPNGRKRRKSKKGAAVEEEEDAEDSIQDTGHEIPDSVSVLSDTTDEETDGPKLGYAMKYSMGKAKYQFLKKENEALVKEFVALKNKVEGLEVQKNALLDSLISAAK